MQYKVCKKERNTVIELLRIPLMFKIHMSHVVGVVLFHGRMGEV